MTTTTPPAEAGDESALSPSPSSAEDSFCAAACHDPRIPDQPQAIGDVDHVDACPDDLFGDDVLALDRFGDPDIDVDLDSLFADSLSGNDLLGDEDGDIDESFADDLFVDGEDGIERPHGCAWPGPSDIPGPGAHLPDDDSLVGYLRALVGPVRGPAQLWVTVLDADDRMTPVLVVLERIAPTPDRHGTTLTLGRAVLEALSLTPDPRLVVAIVRRGGGAMAPMEARWAGAIRAAAVDLRVPLRAVVSVAADRAVILAQG